MPRKRDLPDSHSCSGPWARLLALSGVDRTIGWSVAPRVWSMLSGPITVALIATRITGKEQGFYFTFASVLALRSLFELGLVGVILQFVSHEFAFLEWLPDGTIGGSALHKARLASLVRTWLRWYGVTAIVVTLMLLIGGTIFFSQRSGGVSGWLGPWIVVALMTGAGMILSPVLAVIEGCGAVADVARLRTAQAVTGHLGCWTLLLAGGRLWAAAATATAALIVGVVEIRWKRWYLLADLVRTTGVEVSWRDEVWPFQWRSALSGTTSALVLQTFTPLIFLYEGPAAAGQMGMTLSILSTVLGFSMVWLSSKRPAFAMRVARREFVELDALFFPAMARAFVVMLAGSLAFIAGAMALSTMHHPWHERLLAPRPLLMLTGSFLATQIIWSESTYLRAHKQEALMGVRLTASVLIVAASVLLGPRWGVTGVTAGFLIINTVVVLGGGTLVFLGKRREWHR